MSGPIEQSSQEVQPMSAEEWANRVNSELAISRAANETLKERLQFLEQLTVKGAKNPGVGGPKPNKPNAYNGAAKERVDLWVFEMEQYFAATGLAYERQVAYAASFLHGAAAAWWRTHVIQAAQPNSGIALITKWFDFSNSIISQFKPINSEKVARDRLVNLVQVNSVIKYVYEFNLLCLDVPNMSEDEKLDKFVRGLKPNIQSQVLIEDPLTVHEAMSVAQRIDSIHYRVLVKNKYGENQGKKNRRRDYGGSRPMEIDNIEHQEGDARKDSANVNAINRNGMSKEERDRCFKERLCFKCKKPGHLSRDCRSGNKKFNRKKSGNGQGRQ